MLGQTEPLFNFPLDFFPSLFPTSSSILCPKTSPYLLGSDFPSCYSYFSLIRYLISYREVYHDEASASLVIGR